METKADSVVDGLWDMYGTCTPGTIMNANLDARDIYNLIRNIK